MSELVTGSYSNIYIRYRVYRDHFIVPLVSGLGSKPRLQSMVIQSDAIGSILA